MSADPEIRRLTDDDTISVEVLRDFVLTVLRHDAIADVLVGQMAVHARRDRPGAAGLAAVLPQQIGDVLHVVTEGDWLVVAETLIEAAREELPGGEGL